MEKLFSVCVHKALTLFIRSFLLVILCHVVPHYLLCRIMLQILLGWGVFRNFKMVNLLSK